MTKAELIAEALSIAVAFYQEEDIYEPTPHLIQRAKEWSEKINFKDPKTLRAAIITGGYIEGMTLHDVEAFEPFFFTRGVDTNDFVL